jgi:hypothetical protein
MARYFIATAGGNVVDTAVFFGDEGVIVDTLIAKYSANHPSVVVSEVDETAYKQTVVIVPKTKAQSDWATLKASSPTALQIATFFAKYLGLE